MFFYSATDMEHSNGCAQNLTPIGITCFNILFGYVLSILVNLIRDWFLMCFRNTGISIFVFAWCDFQCVVPLRLYWWDVLRLLLENLSDEVGSTRAMVFGALTEMLKQESLIVSFQGFTELIILKVLEAHRDEEKDVSFTKLTTIVKVT